MDNKTRLEVKKAEALVATARKVDSYRAGMYDEKICMAILSKKADLIKKAKSVEELTTIMSGPKPFDDSGMTVPEEECLMWAEASLRAPLNGRATERYLSLADSIFGKGILEA